MTITWVRLREVQNMAESEEIFTESLENSENIIGNQLIENEQTRPDDEEIEDTHEDEIELPQENEHNTNISEAASATAEVNDKNPSIDKGVKSSEIRLTQLPLAKIKNIMKLDPDFKLTSGEAVFLVTKATELLIQSLAKEAYVFTAQAKKKTIQKRDVDLAIASVESLSYLEGVNF